MRPRYKEWLMLALLGIGVLLPAVIGFFVGYGTARLVLR